MVKTITRNIMFLKQGAKPATEEDKSVGQDLLDTLNAHQGECVGMAANMIGVNKAIIVVNMGMTNVLMYNPVIVSQSGEFETEEGCLSLTGTRKTKRYKEIEVQYQDSNFQTKKQKFSGWTAQIIQHECDHLRSGYII